VQDYTADQGTMIQGKAEKKGKKIWILLTSGPGPEILKRNAQLNSFFTALKFQEWLKKTFLRNLSNRL
jgi:hypothetical protein